MKRTIIIMVAFMMSAIQIMADENTYLNFTAIEGKPNIILAKYGTPNTIDLEYSTDGCNTWKSYTIGSAITLNKDETVYFKARSTNPSLVSTSGGAYKFVMAGGKVSADGNIMSLLDANMQTKSVARQGFASVFEGCQVLVKAPALPATSLGEMCYMDMFNGCTSLTEAPKLPATTLSNRCYYQMFKGCTSLTYVPDLKATTLASECCRYMFAGCTSLVLPPALPAKRAVDHCYANMFENCSSLIKLPKLPATYLGERCYFMMFKGCASLRINGSSPGVEWSIPSNAVENEKWNQDMFTGTGGGFTSWPDKGVTYYVASDTTGTDVDNVYEDNNQIIVGPNPAQVGEDVCLMIDDYEEAVIEVLTLDGLIVRRIEANSRVMDIEGFDVAGIYIVRVVDKKGNIQTQKLIVE